jgi:HEPN domain-containing protein
MPRAAERDLLTLQSMRPGAPEEAFGFHLQQATEKALKAWIAALGEEYPLTHSIETLFRRLEALSVDTRPFQEGLDSRNPSRPHTVH